MDVADRAQLVGANEEHARTVWELKAPQETSEAPETAKEGRGEWYPRDCCSAFTSIEFLASPEDELPRREYVLALGATYGTVLFLEGVYVLSSFKAQNNPEV
jgi:hypothetical protein